MFAEKLYNSYDQFKEQSLSHRRFKHSDIVPLIVDRDTNLFEITELGDSYLGKKVFCLKAGKGKTKVLLWSQMHGNEPTATQALIDIFNLIENPGEFSETVNSILQECTLLFVPLLNPDGCDLFIRRNAQDIDINRDALRLESPESKMLMNLRDEIKPKFGFNLHDQDVWYTAGDTKLPATVSFLAPSFNNEKDIDEGRTRSMQLISSMNDLLQKFIPGQTAKYYDDFMPTAFGDNVQKRGTSTILIESGGQYNDPEKQYVRKLNFVIIMHALKSIAERLYEQVNTGSYDSLPFNKKNMLFDYLVRNAIISGPEGMYIADLGIRKRLDTEEDKFIVDDIGDLSLYHGYEEINLNGAEFPYFMIGDEVGEFLNFEFYKE